MDITHLFTRIVDTVLGDSTMNIVVVESADADNFDSLVELADNRPDDDWQRRVVRTDFSIPGTLGLIIE